MDDTPHFAALVATGPTRVLSLSREKFETLLDTHPRAVYKTMRSIMRVVHAIQRRLSMQMASCRTTSSRPTAATSRAGSRQPRPPSGWRRTGRVRHTLT